MKKLFSAVQEQEAKVEMRKNVASTEGWGGLFAGHLTGCTLTGLAYTGLPVVGEVAGGAVNAGAAALVNNYNKKITKEARARPFTLTIGFHVPQDVPILEPTRYISSGGAKVETTSPSFI
jgi:hypothetical protein